MKKIFIAILLSLMVNIWPSQIFANTEYVDFTSAQSNLTNDSNMSTQDIPEYVTSYFVDKKGNIYLPGSQLEIRYGTSFSDEFTLHTKGAWTFKEEGDGTIYMNPSSGNAGDTKIVLSGLRVGNISIQIQMLGVGNDTFTMQVYPAVKAGDIIVKYIDTDGKKIAEDVVKSGNVGEAYTTEQKMIDGYTFKEVQGNALGVFTDQAQTVNYVYTKAPVVGGDVTAKYVDTDGKKIAEDVVKSGNVGEAYTTEQKMIDGYTFKEVQGNALGVFTDQAQTVNYVYQKNVTPITPVNPTRPHTPNGKTPKGTAATNTLLQTGEHQIVSSLMIILGTLVLGAGVALFKNNS